MNAVLINITVTLGEGDFLNVILYSKQGRSQ